MNIYSLLMELKTWIQPEQAVINKAKASTITTKNNKKFKELVNGWMNGAYDEDPRLLYDRVCNMLN